ncbi:hypothetical protein ACFTZJ_30570 [Streptomyces globisporus]|uniref:hypothetical protein n=1 Tax=Streptomyces globisporus TaxID=1908 RepID=UPI00363DAD82
MEYDRVRSSPGSRRGRPGCSCTHRLPLPLILPAQVHEKDGRRATSCAGCQAVAVIRKHGETEATLRWLRHLFVNRANLHARLAQADKRPTACCGAVRAASPSSRSSPTCSLSRQAKGARPLRRQHLLGIEVAAAVMVLVRLVAEIKGCEPDEAKERGALKFIAIRFFALGPYVRDLFGGGRHRPGLFVADAAETKLCAWLSVSTFVGLLAFAASARPGSTRSPAS